MNPQNKLTSPYKSLEHHINHQKELINQHESIENPLQNHKKSVGTKDNSI